MLPERARHSDPASPLPDTLLIVEDEVLVRLALADYLRDCGYRVFEATSVAEARQVLTSGTRVDLVFSDVNLAGEENGFALAAWLRREHPPVRIILTSGLTGAAQHAGELCAEEQHLLAKPYSHAVVLQRIQALLRNAADG